MCDIILQMMAFNMGVYITGWCLYLIWEFSLKYINPVQVKTVEFHWKIILKTAMGNQ